jgi:rfaE bifunctional protein kinase chain/domain
MNVPAILQKIRDVKVLVVGDLCLDRWCRYDPALAEESRETRIPRVAVVSTEVTPGAAGTIANNLRALHVDVAIATAIGTDGFGFELERALDSNGIGAEFVYRAPDLATFTYTKLINRDTGVEDLPRVDFIQASDLPTAVEDAVIQRIASAWDGVDVVMVSDQAETQTGGVVTPRVREWICSRAAEDPGKIVWVDSRVRTEHFRNVLLKPNRDEAEASCLRALGRIDFPAFREYLQAPLLIVTRGGDGATIYTAAGETDVLSQRIENPVDICGAGDSFSAGAAVALRVTGSPEEAVRFGNLVASITIMKAGTGTASPAELLAKASSS